MWPRICILKEKAITNVQVVFFPLKSKIVAVKTYELVPYNDAPVSHRLCQAFLFFLTMWQSQMFISTSNNHQPCFRSHLLSEILHLVHWTVASIFPNNKKCRRLAVQQGIFHILKAGKCIVCWWFLLCRTNEVNNSHLQQLSNIIVTNTTAWIKNDQTLLCCPIFL